MESRNGEVLRRGAGLDIVDLHPGVRCTGILVGDLQYLKLERVSTGTRGGEGKDRRD